LIEEPDRADGAPTENNALTKFAPPANRHKAGALRTGNRFVTDLFSLREKDMTRTSPEQNKALVLEAFDTLFNKRDYVAAQRFWSDRYFQHSAHIPPGRDGLFNLVRGLPSALRHEHHVILAEGDYVIAHGRFSGAGRPKSSPPISYASKTASSPSTGTFFRTKRPKRNP
jgi:hypothetical protein